MISKLRYALTRLPVFFRHAALYILEDQAVVEMFNFLSENEKKDGFTLDPYSAITEPVALQWNDKFGRPLLCCLAPGSSIYSEEMISAAMADGHIRDDQGRNLREGAKGRSVVSSVLASSPAQEKAMLGQAAHLASLGHSFLALRRMMADRYRVIHRSTGDVQSLPEHRAEHHPKGEYTISVRWNEPRRVYNYEKHEVLTHRGPVCEHERSGSWRTSKLGKVFWVDQYKAGSPDVPRKTIIKLKGSKQ